TDYQCAAPIATGFSPRPLLMPARSPMDEPHGRASWTRPWPRMRPQDHRARIPMRPASNDLLGKAGFGEPTMADPQPPTIAVAPRPAPGAAGARAGAGPRRLPPPAS